MPPAFTSTAYRLAAARTLPVLRGTLFQRPVGHVKAVDGISFSVRQGEVLGLVGESGCGKTTVARSILKLIHPTGGQILFDGEDIWSQDRAAQFAYRRRIQAVFQDPYSSLNPRMKVRDTVGEPFRIHMPSMSSAQIDVEVRRLDAAAARRRLPARSSN